MQHLSKFTQENVISLLCWDENNCSLVRNSVSIELFDSPYREVATLCFNYWDKYKKPIGDHIADELEPYLSSAQGEKYRELLISLFQLKDSFSNFNSKYIIEKLTEFIRDQRFVDALYNASELHAKGETLEAQEVLRKSFDFNLSIFDPGVKLTDINLLAKSLVDDGLFPTGIAALDDMKVGPARGQLLVYLATKSSGKSWYTIQVAKMAVMHGYKVAHITLEISKEIALQRYIQSLLGITRWHYDLIKSPLFTRNGIGEFEKIDLEGLRIEDPRSMEDPDIIDHISEKLKDIGPKLSNCLYLKEYPSGSLSLPILRGYLDSLESTENFVPDMLIVDMPRNMKLNVKDFRLEMDQLYIGLRGLAVERNIAVVAPHQINREGAKSKFITGEHISEDWGILGTADTALIYNQKETERVRNLARLYVDRGRSMRSQFTVLLSQSYATGQYCIDSVRLPADYNPTTGLQEKKAEALTNEEERPKRREGRVKLVEETA